MNRVEEKVTAAVNKCIDRLSVVLFLVIFILALCQICMRYVLNKPLVWSEELIRYAFVWICYLGWVLGTRNRSHIQITIIVNLLPKILHKMIDTLNSLILIVFSAYMIVYGIGMTKASTMLPAITIPITISFVYAVVPFANTLIIVYELLHLKNSVWKRDAGKGAAV